MVLTLPAVFPHRQNRDGSFDSICLKCLLTIGNERIETELTRHERKHICNPSVLSQLAFDLSLATFGGSLGEICR